MEQNLKEQLPRAIDPLLAEAKKAKHKIVHLINGPEKYLPKWDMVIRENGYHLCNVIYNNCTLLVQFNEHWNTPNGAPYLLFANVKGLFNQDGTADVFHQPQMSETVRYDPSKDNEGNFVWRNKENPDDFDNAENLADKWLRKFAEFAKTPVK